MIMVPERFKTSVGKIGTIQFKEGLYGYIGSARSSNYTRLGRHANVSDGENDTRHWHIDYLIGNDNATLYGAYTLNHEEEQISLMINGVERVPEFGSSDSQSASHLFYTPNSETFIDTVEGTFEQYEYYSFEEMKKKKMD